MFFRRNPSINEPRGSRGLQEQSHESLDMVSSGFPKLDVGDVLQKLTVQEKIVLTAGRDMVS